jgi:hypothetical protein
VVIEGMNLGSNAVNTWWSILFCGANFAPKFSVNSLTFSLAIRGKGVVCNLSVC